MLQIKVNKEEFDKINTLLPDICPDVSFALKVEDENLVSLGFCDSAPCIVEFDMSSEEFYEMLDTLNDIEINAFNVLDRDEPSRSDPAYQKYLKYGCLFNILFSAQRIYNTIGKVKYVGKSFGVDSLTDGRIYPVVSIEDGFIRVVDDSYEDYLYSIIRPSSMEDPDLCGKWEIVEDEKGILKKYINKGK